MTAPEEFGSYLVYEQLGVGGMATVHVAESRGLRKRVALKRLLSHAAENPDLVRSFIHEARLVGYLKHANIAQTYDFGKVGDTYFIAMELVLGPTLGQLIRQCKATVGVIPFPITLNILCQACDALDYAHNLVDEHGAPLDLIHRDVSPPNIIVSNTGTVKLIDFGVAKIAKSSLQTQVGTVKGKFSYMAPEYLNGQLTSRCDLWALGCVAHELLTNRMLFDAPDDLGVLEKVRRAPIVPPSRYNPDVPRDLDAVVLTALERNPAHRWQSAAAMRTALANVATELKTTVPNEQMIEWIQWAFEQEPGAEKTGISQLIELLEKPSNPGARAVNAAAARTIRLDPHADPHAETELHRHVDDERGEPTRAASPRASKQVHAASPASKEMRAESPASKEMRAESPRSGKRLFSTPRVGAAMVKRRSTGRSVLLWLLLIALSAGVGAAVYEYGIPDEIIRSSGST